MDHAVKAIEANLVSRCMVKVYDWSKHAANNCKVNIVTPSPAKYFTHPYIYSYAGAHIIQIMLLDKDKQVSCKTIHGHSTNQEPYPTH